MDSALTSPSTSSAPSSAAISNFTSPDHEAQGREDLESLSNQFAGGAGGNETNDDLYSRSRDFVKVKQEYESAAKVVRGKLDVIQEFLMYLPQRLAYIPRTGRV